MLSNSSKIAVLSCSLIAGLNGCGGPAVASDGEGMALDPGTSKVHQESRNRFPVEIVLESGEVKQASLPLPSAVLGQSGSTEIAVTDSIRYTSRMPTFVVRPVPGTRLPDEVKDFIARNALDKSAATQTAFPHGEPAHALPIVESSKEVAASPADYGAHLMGGESLAGGYSGPNWLTSPSGQYKFIMQTDTNFVHYNGTSPTWATDTAYGQTISWVIMQYDGNLVLYEYIIFWDPEGGPTPVIWPHWSTETNGNPGAYFDVQSDGNSVVYAANGVTPLWSVWYGRAY